MNCSINRKPKVFIVYKIAVRHTVDNDFTQVCVNFLGEQVAFTKTLTFRRYLIVIKERL